MQLVDELSMIYTTCLMAYASFSYSRDRTFRIILAVSLIGLSLFITLYYHYLQDPAFHQNAYVVLTVVVVFRTMFTMEYTLRPSLRRSEEKHRQERERESRDLLGRQEQARLNVRDKAILKDMWILVAFGLTAFLGGFAIWTLDNEYCPRLRRWRRNVGLPWGVLLEGHGWW
jgi:dihydroceramidase